MTHLLDSGRRAGVVTIGRSDEQRKERPIHIPFYQKALSYLQPVTLAQSIGPVGGYLELILSRNQLVLLTDGALYSDGKRYLPAVTIADELAPELGGIRSVLVLGVGLGSIVRVLRSRGHRPRYTLVERDNTVLRWAMETLADQEPDRQEDLEPVCQDAEAFMLESGRKFDLVFVDVFKGRRAPDFVTTPLFLGRCRDSLEQGGRVALNYLVYDERKWERFRETLDRVLPGGTITSIRDNRIFVSAPAPASRPAIGPHE